MQSRPVDERLGRVAVHHVVGQRPAIEDGLGQRWNFTLQARGRAVDDDVEMLPLEFVEPVGFDLTVGSELFSEFARLDHRAVGDHKFGGMVTQNRIEYTAHRPTGTEDQYLLVAQRNAQVVFDVVHQPGTIGVVAEQLAVFFETQAVHGLGQLRPVAALVGQPVGIGLERHGDVEPLAAERTELVDGLRQAADVDLDGGVFDVMAELAREQLVNRRRLGVCDGVAHHRVAVGSIEFEGVSHGVVLPAQCTSRLCRSGKIMQNGFAQIRQALMKEMTGAFQQHQFGWMPTPARPGQR